MVHRLKKGNEELEAVDGVCVRLSASRERDSL